MGRKVWTHTGTLRLHFLPCGRLMISKKETERGTYLHDLYSDVCLFLLWIFSVALWCQGLLCCLVSQRLPEKLAGLRCFLFYPTCRRIWTEVWGSFFGTRSNLVAQKGNKNDAFDSHLTRSPSATPPDRSWKNRSLEKPGAFLQQFGSVWEEFKEFGNFLKCSEKFSSEIEEVLEKQGKFKSWWIWKLVRNLKYICVQTLRMMKKEFRGF